MGAPLPSLKSIEQKRAEIEGPKAGAMHKRSRVQASNGPIPSLATFYTPPTGGKLRKTHISPPPKQRARENNAPGSHCSALISASLQSVSLSTLLTPSALAAFATATAMRKLTCRRSVREGRRDSSGSFRAGASLARAATPAAKEEGVSEEREREGRGRTCDHAVGEVGGFRDDDPGYEELAFDEQRASERANTPIRIQDTRGSCYFLR